MDWYTKSIFIAIVLFVLSYMVYMWGKKAFGKSEKVEQLQAEVNETREKEEAAASERDKKYLRSVSFDVQNTRGIKRVEGMQPLVTFRPCEAGAGKEIGVLLDDKQVGTVPPEHRELIERIMYRQIQTEPYFYEKADGDTALRVTVSYKLTPGELVLEEARAKHE